MNKEDVENLIEKFLADPKLQYAIECNLLDGQLLVEFILFLNTQLLFRTEGKLNYQDIETLEKVYLLDFPSLFLEFSEEAVQMHFMLLSYYNFLAERQVIDEESYKQILLAIQQQSFIFLKRMNDEKNWSQEKQASLLEVQEEATDAMVSTLKAMIEEIQSNDFLNFSSELNVPNQNKKLANNIIPLPTKNKQELITPVSNEKILQLQVKIQGVRPVVWRRILVPQTLTYEQLHQVIQKAFNWQNNHLYAFVTPRGEATNQGDQEEMATWYPVKLLTPEKTSIWEDFETTDEIMYTYDFSNDWRHTIKLEQVLSLAEVSCEHLPACIDGQGNAVGEDATTAQGQKLHGSTMTVPFALTEINKDFKALTFSQDLTNEL